jgi:hypothetical protein
MWDCIATTDWNLLIGAKDRYDCLAPQFRCPVVHIVTTEQAITHHSESAADKRIEAFLYNLHFQDDKLASYGS